MRDLDRRTLALERFTKIRGKLELERLPKFGHGAVFAPLAIGEDGVPVPSRDGGFQIDPAAVQVPATLLTFSGLLLPRLCEAACSSPVNLARCSEYSFKTCFTSSFPMFSAAVRKPSCPSRHVRIRLF